MAFMYKILEECGSQMTASFINNKNISKNISLEKLGCSQQIRIFLNFLNYNDSHTTINDVIIVCNKETTIMMLHKPTSKILYCTHTKAIYARW